jgi:hypothetical protein
MAVWMPPAFAGIVYPPSTPRIGWRRITGTVAASTSAAGFAAANAATYRTDSFWRPTALGATWRLDAGSAQNVSYVGIAGHDMGTRALTIQVQSSTDDSAWTTRLNITPTDDSAIFGLMGLISARYWRLSITGAGGNPTIAVIQFGAVTEFPRPCVYAPSISLQRTRRVTYSTNITEGGQWAGRTINRVSLAPSMTVNHLSETWVTSEWDAFALHAETSPFFIADRPGSFANSCAYAWTGDDLRAERGTPNADIANTVSLELTGFLA